MTENSPVPTGKHGREPVAAAVGAAMAEEVDTLVERVQTPGFEAPLDHAGSKPGTKQLRT
jgi:hypothetical protein